MFVLPLPKAILLRTACERAKLPAVEGKKKSGKDMTTVDGSSHKPGETAVAICAQTYAVTRLYVE